MRLVPTAQARVDAALTGYVADQNEFQAVIEAEHDRSDALLERERALCDIYRRAADLDRGARAGAGNRR
jgi:hypothetical protein